MVKVHIKTSGNYHKIYLNDIIHFQFRCDDIYAIQTWIEGTDWFCIEFYLKNGIIKTEYDSKQKWLAIIDALDKIKL